MQITHELAEVLRTLASSITTLEERVSLLESGSHDEGESLAAVVASFGSTKSNVLDVETPRTPTPKASKRSKRSASPKATSKSAENKAAYQAIRDAVSEGNWADAIEMAEMRGWVGEADRLRDRAAKASAKPTKAQRKSTKSTKVQRSVIDDSVVEELTDHDVDHATVAPTVEDVLKSLRGRAMSQVSWARRKAEPERIQGVIDEVTPKVKAARKVIAAAKQVEDLATVEGQTALLRGYLDVLDHLVEAQQALEEELTAP